jgi:PAS domain S-box-containing protein
MSLALPKEVARQKILVVDDNPASLYATSHILRAAGFDVLEANNGGKALEMADEVGLLVLDINLPDIDGFEVCRRLRARSNTAYLPVVHLSATFMDTADMSQGLAAGADSYLTHPADPAVLIATVRALLFARQADVVKRAADARFRKVFELAAGGIALLDADLAYRDVNAAMCAIANRDRNEIISHSFGSLLAPGQEEAAEAAHRALRSTGQWDGALWLARPDGSRAAVEWRIAFESGGDTCIGIATDVTERQRSELERERLLESERVARADAERSNQIKDEFLAVLSHELRNPLNAILGWAKVLSRSADTTALVRQGLEAIERNSILQSHLIADLLDIAGIRFGKLRLDVAPTSPAAAIHSAMEIVAPQAQRKGVELRADIRDADARVLADEGRLQQVVWNLLSNAIKFTPAAGRVEIVAHMASDRYQIAISDTGQGISAEFIPRLFDRFSQQESGASKRFAGLGIGLTIVRHLVEAHNGTIEASSPGIGKGAVFRVSLPLTQQQPRPTEQSDAEPLKGIKALVVEDNSDARALIARILGEMGVEVCEAGGADEALAFMAHSVPDVLISDIGMANQHGYQLLRTIRAGGFTAEMLPAIALTAFSRPQDREDSLQAGFQVHLAKPVNADILKSTVATLLLGRTPRTPVKPH